MKKEQQMVYDFHVKYALPISQGFNTNMLLRRHAFISEECGELAKAIMECDDGGIIDALADIMYFVLGTAVVLGVDLESVFNEAHQKNMMKPVIKSAAGKVLKLEK